MPIRIYNSLTRKKEEFIPVNQPKVNIYTCGVTVYDESHIGHARSLYIFDLIRRYLIYRGFKVKFVRNITDIDDKIINRSNELKVDWKELVRKYIERYEEDLNSLGISKGDFEPRATGNIPGMIRYISALIDKGYAYEVGGDVYFNVRRFNNYGALSGQAIEEMRKGVRIEPNELKKDPLDFALWKKSKENEPSWKSPWGLGRPGWHIECSVMSQKFLSCDTLDIHAGGRDLIFPHHENEIAQAEALTGKPFAKYWLHHGLLTMNGQKMSKSLGNFVTIKDFIAKYVDVDFLKLFFLSAHYSHPIDYSEDKIEEAWKQQNSFYDFFDKVNILNQDARLKIAGLLDEDKKAVDGICLDFENAMDDDFNTPGGLASLFKLRDLGLGFVSAGKKDAFNYVKLAIEKYFIIFGLKIAPKVNLPQEALDLFNKRTLAKEMKDFKEADRIRAIIEKTYNICISDTVSSTTASSIRINPIKKFNKDKEDKEKK